LWEVVWCDSFRLIAALVNSGYLEMKASAIINKQAILILWLSDRQRRGKDEQRKN